MQTAIAFRLAVPLAVTCAVIALVGATVTSAATAPLSGKSCEISSDDKIANARLTFDAFDQRGTTSSTWRQLSDHGCNTAALESAEDYLVHARFEKPSEQRDVIFHIAQTLGMLGRYEAAALMAASAKEPNPSPNSNLDWNTYLDGTWAFFKRDMSNLQRAQHLLNTESGSGNKLNGGVLRGLISCFDKPYSIAYGKACRTEQ